MVTQNSCDYQPTQYNVQTGGASGTLNNVAPSATSGVPVISQGASAQPVFGTAVVAGGGTGAVTLTGVLTGNGTSAITANTVTQHGTLIGGASNAVGSLGVASNGQLAIGSTGADPVLATITAGAGVTVTNGAGTITIAATSAAGSFVLLHTLTASSSSSLAFTSTYVTSTYSAYLVIFNQILSSTGTTFNMDLSTNNGSGYLNSNYQSSVTYIPWNSATLTNQNSTSTIPLTGSGDQSSTLPTSGHMWIYGAGASFFINGEGKTFQGGNASCLLGFAQISSAVTVNNIKFSMAAGTIASGTISLYGLVQ